MIKDKEDFRRKYIKLSLDIGEEEFNEIKDRFEELGLNTRFLILEEIRKNTKDYFYIWLEHGLYLHTMSDSIFFNEKSKITEEELLTK